MSEQEPVNEVCLRRRSTPYDFVVKVTSEDRTLEIYQGRSYQYALSAYWQGVSTLRFLRASGIVHMGLTKKRRPFGGFRTEIEAGLITALHHALGGCEEWTGRGWGDKDLAEKVAELSGGGIAPGKVGGDIAEKIMATIPGTQGLPRDPH